MQSRDPLQVLIIPGLTLPEVSESDLKRIHDAAGPGANVIVTSQRDAHQHAETADVILGFVPPALYQAAPRLRWVHAIASGVDAFLYPEFAASDVILTSEKGLVGEHLADHAFGLLLMLTRQLATALKLGAELGDDCVDTRIRKGREGGGKGKIVFDLPFCHDTMRLNRIVSSQGPCR